MACSRYSHQPHRPSSPDNINYQGYLTDSEGIPIDTDTSITFSLYSVGSGGSALWSDTQTVNVSKGLFSVQLGRPGNVFPMGLFDTPLWLGISVGADPEMISRKAINSTAFAHEADNALTLDGVAVSNLVMSDELTLHSNNASAHHSKTTSFTDLTDQAADVQIPTGITRDWELESHASDSDPHHAKTTSFTELTDQATDAQLPATITRDSEIMPEVLANDGPGSGLNADLLDGQTSASFMTSGTDNWVNTTGDTMTGNLGVLANVGVGISSPSYPLDVQGGKSGYLGYFKNDNNTSSGLTVGLYAKGSIYNSGNGWAMGGFFLELVVAPAVKPLAFGVKLVLMGHQPPMVCIVTQPLVPPPVINGRFMG